MINRKLTLVTLLCLMASPMIAMKRAGSDADDVPSAKRCRIDITQDIFDAIENEDFDTTMALISIETDVNKQNPLDGNSLLLSVWLSNFTLEQRKEMYHALKSRGVDINAVASHTGSSLLHLVSLDGDVLFVRQLLLDGANPHLENYDGETPLFYVRTSAVINELVLFGADVNHQDKKGRTPLFEVANIEEHEKANALVLWGACCDLVDNKRRTAYMWQQRNFGNAYPAVKSNEIARNEIIMPTFVKGYGNPVKFLLNREKTGRIAEIKRLTS
jgi:ankyrin repeat protein